MGGDGYVVIKKKIRKRSSGATIIKPPTDLLQERSTISTSSPTSISKGTHGSLSYKKRQETARRISDINNRVDDLLASLEDEPDIVTGSSSIKSKASDTISGVHKQKERRKQLWDKINEQNTKIDHDALISIERIDETSLERYKKYDGSNTVTEDVLIESDEDKIAKIIKDGRAKGYPGAITDTAGFRKDVQRALRKVPHMLHHWGTYRFFQKAEHIFAKGNVTHFNGDLLTKFNMSWSKTGYYGSVGHVIIIEEIIKALKSRLLEMSKSNSVIAFWTVDDFIQYVLSPEVSVTMIQSELGLDNREDAYRVHMESSEYGKIVNGGTTL